LQDPILKILNTKQAWWSGSSGSLASRSSSTSMVKSKKKKKKTKNKNTASLSYSFFSLLTAGKIVSIA
jgi:Na+/citrate or Na+/malate symporter